MSVLERVLPRPDRCDDKTGYIPAVGGRRFEAVTHALARCGMYKLRGTPDQLDQARREGVETHRVAAEVDIFGEALILPDEPDTMEKVEAWRALCAEWQATPVLVEEPVVSMRYGYAGTLDRVLQLSTGALVICDLKRSHSPATRLQTAAYTQAFCESYGASLKDVNMRVAVALRDGKASPKWFTTESLYEDLHAFIACLTVLRWKERMGIE